jgi:flavin reductase (DIM6/NTAB) family NADH-FMN oxidoreductase RutF
MRLVGASVLIVTTRWRGEPLGLTATAVCSVSADPPHLLACINRDAEAHDAILASGRFAVSLLTARHQALAERFAGRGGVNGSARFAEGQWRDGALGVPVLADASAVLECMVEHALPVASHTVFVGAVVHAAASGPDEVLAYRDGTYGRFAPAPASLAV